MSSEMLLRLAPANFSRVHACNKDITSPTYSGDVGLLKGLAGPIGVKRREIKKDRLISSSTLSPSMHGTWVAGIRI